jgi:ATPase subunit of ABC transporter with duplicated ATPase domains
MPTTHSSPAVAIDRVTFTWPDGTTALHDVSGAFGAGRSGPRRTQRIRQVDAARSRRALAPASGTISTTGTVDLLPQRPTPERTVASRTSRRGRAARRRAAIAAGDASPQLFDAVGDEWTSRRAAAASRPALPPGILDRRIGQLSGGEAVLAALVGARLRAAPIALLDEPTNNLDRGARPGYELVRRWRGALIVVSHDTTLLDLMDDTAELYGSALSTFGGPTQWREALDAEQAAARQAEAAARQVVRREKRDRIHQSRCCRPAPRSGARPSRRSAGRGSSQGRGSAPAQESAGRCASRRRQGGAGTVGAGCRGTACARRRQRAHRPARSRRRGRAPARDPARRRRSWVVQGPERIALIGPNGAGKTTPVRRPMERRDKTR